MPGAAIMLLAVLAGASPGDLKRAEQAAAQALKAHQRGAFAEAGALFLEAHTSSGRAQPLRNAAKSFEAAKMFPEALDAWTRYEARPDVDATKKSEAAQRIAALSALLKPPVIEEPPPRAIEVAPPPQQPPPARVTPQPQPRPQPLVAPKRAPSNVTGYALIGGGALAVIGGGVLYGTSWGTYGTYRDTMATGQKITREDANDAELRASTGIALAAAGTAIITAALLFAFDD